MNFISKFKKLLIPYKTGAFKSPIDNRNIPAKAVLPKDIIFPVEYESVLGKVLDQEDTPRCVGFAGARGLSDLIGVELSPDDLYDQCKEQDGIPDQDGTYISVMAKVATNNGICLQDSYYRDNKKEKDLDRILYKVNGYIWVDADFDQICQTISQKSFVVCALDINSKWYKGIITRVLKSIGFHAVILKGYDYNKKILKGRNSWGSSWIGKIAGMIDRTVKDGDFELLWNDYSDKIYDIVAFSYIPPEIKKDTKYTYRFMTILKLGSKGYDVKKLQDILGLKSDGVFGPNTQSFLKKWQLLNNLKADGIFGHDSRVIMNKTAKSLIPDWAMAIQKHEGYMNEKQYPPKGSRSFRNNNPANFKTGSLTSFIKNLGATGIDKDGFAIFPTYEIGFDALKKFLTMACTNKLSLYKSTMTLNQFFSTYAPANDGNNVNAYANYVAKCLGCTVNTKIDELL